MSLTSSLQRIVQAKADIKTAIENKGVTVGNDVSIANYDDYIDAIQTGSSATLTTKTITANGTYNAEDDNADGYSSVTVNVSGGGGGSSDVPFNTPRYLEIPTGNIYDCKTISHYIIGTTWRYSSAYSYVVGNKFVVYDINTQEIVHTYTTEETSPDIYYMNYANNKWLIVISQWSSNRTPYAIWWYDGDNDEFEYVEDSANIPSTFNNFNIRYCFVGYQGNDFGIIKTNNAGLNQYVVIKADKTTENLTSISSSVNLITTYDEDYIYVAADFRTLETSSYYKVVVVSKSTNNFHSIVSYYMNTGSSNQRVIYQCGRFAFMCGYNTNRLGYVVNILTGQKIVSLNNSYRYNGRIMIDADNKTIVAIGSGRTFSFDGNAYLSGTTPYYVYDTSTTYTYNNHRLINHKFYFATATGFFEVVPTTGIVLRIDLQGYTMINECINGTDAFVTYSSTGTNYQYVIYVYHTNTNTYDNIKTDTTSICTFSNYATASQAWSRVNTTFCSHLYAFGTNNNTGFVIFNDLNNEYIYIRRNAGTSVRIIDTDYLATSGFYGDETNLRIYVIKQSGGYVSYQTDTLSTSAPNLSFGYRYGNKIYFQCCFTSPLKFYILCYDIENNTISVSAEDSTNMYNSYFMYYKFNNTSSGSATYQPIEQGNLVLFGYVQSGLNGHSFDVSQQVSSSPQKSLVFNKTTGIWSIISGAYSICAHNYNENIIVYSSSSNAVSFYNLATGVTTSTGITACNLGAFKCMPNGHILIKQTTNLMDYNIASQTSTVLKTATNNGNSNSYGSIRGLKNIVYTMFYNACGVYNSTTSTFTSMSNNSNWYSSTGTSNMHFNDIVSGTNELYVLYYKDSTYLYVYKGNYNNPAISGSSYYYAEIYFDTDKYIIFESTSTAPRNDNVYKYYYDGTSSVTHYFPKPVMPQISNMSQLVTVFGKEYLYNYATQGIYDIENDEYFSMVLLNPLNYSSSGGFWLNINIQTAQVMFFELRKSYVWTMHYGARTGTRTGYSSGVTYAVLDTTDTTTKLFGLYSPTNEELSNI